MLISDLFYVVDMLGWLMVIVWIGLRIFLCDGLDGFGFGLVLL